MGDFVFLGPSMIELTPAQYAYTPLKVAFMSGLSEPRSCALTSRQQAFLRSLAAPESCKVYCNFPFVPTRAIPLPPPPLWKASLRNTAQFLRARRPGYARRARKHLEALSDSADRLVLITLSCGLEIANRCLADLAPGKQIFVFALGPVAWTRPIYSHVFIQGSRDYVSKLFTRTVDVRLNGVGHLSYLDDPQVSELINDKLCNSISNS
ncbi:MAG: hypothetical protein KDB22_20150 [Planctomycetales bacterium]|nr:hypothetical protein [Planctomycetales bacterium]